MNNYPNPFNPTTTIEYGIEEESKVIIDIFNIKGECIKKLIDEIISAGNHAIIWNGQDDTNKPAPSGVYLYKLHTENYIKIKKMILLR